MAVLITDTCINCGACEPECPNQAIYETGAEWNMAEGTSVTGSITLLRGAEVGADEMQDPISEEFYFIVADKCTECKGFHDEPQCIEACPVPDCIIIDPDHVESEDVLIARKELLHS